MANDCIDNLTWGAKRFPLVIIINLLLNKLKMKSSSLSAMGKKTKAY